MRFRSHEGWYSYHERMQKWHRKYALTPTRAYCGPEHDTWCWVWLEYYWRRFAHTDMFLASYNRRTEEWHSHSERP